MLKKDLLKLLKKNTQNLQKKTNNLFKMFTLCYYTTTTTRHPITIPTLVSRVAVFTPQSISQLIKQPFHYRCLFHFIIIVFL